VGVRIKEPEAPTISAGPARPVWGRQQPQQQQTKQPSAGPVAETEAAASKGSKAASEKAPTGTATEATATGTRAKGVEGSRGTPVRSEPPGNSSITDTSFSIDAARLNKFSSKVLTAESEAAVGAKLEQATQLKAQDAQSAAAQPLREQIPAGSRAPAITKPVLLKEPVISDPQYPAPADTLASAKPDYLLLMPEKIEVFEVTLDKSFSIVPRHKGMRIRRGASRAGDPHKQIQVRKTLEYLMRRYPDSPLIYNIQTIGDIPEGMLKILRTDLDVVRRLQKKLGSTGRIQLVVRGGKNYVIE
jgi:hypothetical protein